MHYGLVHTGSLNPVEYSLGTEQGWLYIRFIAIQNRNAFWVGRGVKITCLTTAMYVVMLLRVGSTVPSLDILLFTINLKLSGYGHLQGQREGRPGVKAIIV